MLHTPCEGEGGLKGLPSAPPGAACCLKEVATWRRVGWTWAQDQPPLRLLVCCHSFHRMSRRGKEDQPHPPHTVTQQKDLTFDRSQPLCQDHRPWPQTRFKCHNASGSDVGIWSVGSPFCQRLEGRRPDLLEESVGRDKIMCLLDNRNGSFWNEAAETGRPAEMSDWMPNWMEQSCRVQSWWFVLSHMIIWCCQSAIWLPLPCSTSVFVHKANTIKTL